MHNELDHQNVQILYNIMKQRNPTKTPSKHLKQDYQLQKVLALGATSNQTTQDIKAAFRRSDSQSKVIMQGSSLTSPKNVSTNSKKSQSGKLTSENIPRIQKLTLLESLKIKVLGESIGERKKRKEKILTLQQKQEIKMKNSVMKSLVNVINVDHFSDLNISVAETQIVTCKADFSFLQIIGKGTFGRVWKVQHRKTMRFYAIKEFSKALVVAKKSVQNVFSEKKILKKFCHPLISKMYGSFADRDNLYMILELLSGGDLRYHLTEALRFNQQQGRFMIACVVMGLEALEQKNVAHRDIKPENLMFDNRGYLKLTDFGIAQENTTSVTSGTPGYMAPEVLCKLGHNKVADYFSLGVLAYELMTGKRPYSGRSKAEIRQSILSKQIQIKRGDRDFKWSPEAIQFINRLIQRQPANRLGSTGVESIKNHPWLRKIPWKKLQNFQLIPPFIPQYCLQLSQEPCSHEMGTQVMMRHRLIQRLSDHQQIFSDYYQQFNGNCV